jgi:putative transposase
VLNAILDVLVEGVQWRALPGISPPWPTVYTYLSPSVRLRQCNRRKEGTWVRIHDHLRDWVRIAQDRHPQPPEVVIDSQSVKSAAMVHEAVGYDAGKMMIGRKRFITVETLGLVLRVLVTAASVPEWDGGKQVLSRVKAMGTSMKCLTLIWADGGFSGPAFVMWVMDTCRWIVEVVLRPQQTKGFVLLKKRWVVELTFGWLLA